MTFTVGPRGKVDSHSRGFKKNDYVCIKCGHVLRNRPVATDFVICPRCNNFMKREDGKMVFVR